MLGSAGVASPFGKPIERRQRVVGEDQVDCIVVESRQELGASLGADHVTDEVVGFKNVLDEPRVAGVILQQQNSQCLHVCAFTLASSRCPAAAR